MSNMNHLTLEISQVADTNVFSDDLAGTKENSELFSSLMDKNRGQQQSGKSAIKNGNEEPSHFSSNEKMDNKDNTPINKGHVDSNKKLDTQVKKELDSTTDKESEIQAEEVTKEGVEISDEENNELLIENSSSNNTLPTNSNSTNSPEQLLSFLSASEKVLNASKVTGEAPIVLDNKVGTDPELKTEKTLVAQSITPQVNNEDSSITKKVNELVKSKDNESANSSNANATKIDEKETVTKNILLSDLASSEKELTSETQKIAVEKNIESQLHNKAASNETIQEVSLKAGSEKAKILNEQALKSAINEKDKEVKVTEVSDIETTASATKTANDINNIDKVIDQSKPQVVTQIPNQTNNKNVEFKGDQKLVNSLSASALEESPEVVDSESFNEQVKSVSTNNIVPNKFDQRIERGSKSSQDQTLNKVSDKTIENSENVTEIASENVKDELLNTELKSANNVKLNQSITPLLNTLNQTEVNSRIDGEEYIEDELSFENVMQTLSSDLAKTQKNTVIQQAETISIMRKDFTDAVKDKVMVMINQKIQQIDIQLDPPELGNMQVRINMQNEQAVVNFVVQNQQAKEALDQNMEKLKHMMSENGVDVGESNVKQESDQSAMDRQNNQGSDGQHENNEEGSLEGSMNMEHTKVLKASSTGVDYYV